ncbi:UNVERIFIED_CONTAM: hypothetical protein Slati_3689500 [Sesamum latifolium]|uniref:Reverse transcriptase domain-containing protein n=1 Tax=Sesamum latifolium TaxID=2727402 RepID=A0AAW2U1X0_9LAMI
MGSVEPNVERLKKAWKLIDDEEEGVLLLSGLWHANSGSHTLCLVSRLLSNMPYHFEARSSSIQDLEQCDLFVHIHDLPLNVMNVGVATLIRNRIGTFRDMEADEAGCSWGASLRIWVGYMNRTGWSIIRSDVCASVLDFLNNGSFNPLVNFTQVVLIPKCLNPSDMTQFRPISLCNVIYKLASNTIANRIKPFLDSLISISQSTFVPGCLTMDNMLVAYELNHFLKHITWGKKGHVSVKLDISKTYDRVEWCFLERGASHIRSLAKHTSSIPLSSIHDWARLHPILGDLCGALKISWQQDLGGSAHEWDVELVKAEFCPTDADCILGISLQGSGEGDNLVWHFEKHGKFSVQSAHHVASQLRGKAECSDVERPWGFIWSSKAPPKEDVVHVLFFCSFACVVWALFGLPWRSIACADHSTGEWFGEVHRKLGHWEWDLFLTICWAIWWVRNKRLFRGQSLEAQEIIRMTLRMVEASCVLAVLGMGGLG